MIQLKGPDELKRLMMPGEGSKSLDQYKKYWDHVEQVCGSP